MIVSRKKNIFLSTFNLALIIFGYQFFASLTSPFMNEELGTRIITVPYRSFCLLLTILVIAINCNQKIKMNITIKCLFFYWSILFIRLFYDFYLRRGFYIDIDSKNTTLAFVFLISFPAFISVLKSFSKIDFDLLFKILFFMFFVFGVFNILYNKQIVDTNEVDRASSGLALNTITFGHSGVSLVIASIFLFKFLSKNLLLQIIRLFSVCMGLFIMLKAASRGPVVSLLVVLLIYISFKSGKKWLIPIVAFFMIIIFFFFDDYLFLVINEISPVMHDRILSTIIDGDASGRDGLYNDALNIFYDSPLTGKYFCLYSNSSDHVIIYAHNILLDSMICGGIVGLALMIYFYWKMLQGTFKLVKTSNIWIVLLGLQALIAGLFSGNFYSNPWISIAIALVSYWINQLRERSFIRKS